MTECDDQRSGDEANYVLTGFMGTGKSSVGRALAERLGFAFIDTDDVIVDRHGPIVDIFANHGDAAFRQMERDVVRELAERWGLVIATGGSLMLDPVNAATLLATSSVFCLTATVDELVERLSVGDEHSKRPLLAGTDPAARITELLDERSEGYGSFTQIETTDRSIDQIVDEILSYPRSIRK